MPRICVLLLTGSIAPHLATPLGFTLRFWVSLQRPAAQRALSIHNKAHRMFTCSICNPTSYMEAGRYSPPAWIVGVVAGAVLRSVRRRGRHQRRKQATEDEEAAVDHGCGVFSAVHSLGVFGSCLEGCRLLCATLFVSPRYCGRPALRQQRALPLCVEIAGEYQYAVELLAVYRIWCTRGGPWVRAAPAAPCTRGCVPHCSTSQSYPARGWIATAKGIMNPKWSGFES